MLSFIVDYHNKMEGKIDAEDANEEIRGAVPRLHSNKINILWFMHLMQKKFN